MQMRGRLAWIGLAFLATGVAAQTVMGSGTPDTMPAFNGTSTLTNSAITQFNGNVGIGTTSQPTLLRLAVDSILGSLDIR